MTMHSVSSSNLAAIGWEKGVCRVEFKSGAIWEYSDVPESVYLGVKNSESVGKSFIADIRDSYPAARAN